MRKRNQSPAKSSSLACVLGLSGGKGPSVRVTWMGLLALDTPGLTQLACLE